MGRHKLEEKFAEAVAIGAGGYALHEHHEKKEAKEEAEEVEGEEHKKKHHFSSLTLNDNMMGYKLYPYDIPLHFLFLSHECK